MNQQDFDEYSELEHYQKKCPILVIAWIEDDPQDFQIKYRNGSFQFRSRPRDNLG
jgi:hypothetical protein